MNNNNLKDRLKERLREEGLLADESVGQPFARPGEEITKRLFKLNDVEAIENLAPGDDGRLEPEEVTPDQQSALLSTFQDIPARVGNPSAGSISGVTESGREFRVERGDPTPQIKEDFTVTTKDGVERTIKPNTRKMFPEGLEDAGYVQFTAANRRAFNEVLENGGDFLTALNRFRVNDKMLNDYRLKQKEYLSIQGLNNVTLRSLFQMAETDGDRTIVLQEYLSQFPSHELPTGLQAEDISNLKVKDNIIRLSNGREIIIDPPGSDTMKEFGYDLGEFFLGDAPNMLPEMGAYGLGRKATKKVKSKVLRILLPGIAAAFGAGVSEAGEDAALKTIFGTETGPFDDYVNRTLLDEGVWALGGSVLGDLIVPATQVGKALFGAKNQKGLIRVGENTDELLARVKDADLPELMATQLLNSPIAQRVLGLSIQLDTELRMLVGSQERAALSFAKGGQPSFYSSYTGLREEVTSILDQYKDGLSKALTEAGTSTNYDAGQGIKAALEGYQTNAKKGVNLLYRQIPDTNSIKVNLGKLQTVPTKGGDSFAEGLAKIKDDMLDEYKHVMRTEEGKIKSSSIKDYYYKVGEDGKSNFELLGPSAKVKVEADLAVMDLIEKLGSGDKMQTLSLKHWRRLKETVYANAYDGNGFVREGNRRHQQLHKLFMDVMDNFEVATNMTEAQRKVFREINALESDYYKFYEDKVAQEAMMSIKRVPGSADLSELAYTLTSTNRVDSLMRLSDVDDNMKAIAEAVIKMPDDLVSHADRAEMLEKILVGTPSSMEAVSKGFRSRVVNKILEFDDAKTMLTTQYDNDPETLVKLFGGEKQYKEALEAAEAVDHLRSSGVTEAAKKTQNDFQFASELLDLVEKNGSARDYVIDWVQKGTESRKKLFSHAFTARILSKSVGTRRTPNVELPSEFVDPARLEESLRSMEEGYPEIWSDVITEEDKDLIRTVELYSRAVTPNSADAGSSLMGANVVGGLIRELAAASKAVFISDDSAIDHIVKGATPIITYMVLAGRLRSKGVNRLILGTGDDAAYTTKVDPVREPGFMEDIPGMTLVGLSNIASGADSEIREISGVEIETEFDSMIKSIRGLEDPAKDRMFSSLGLRNRRKRTKVPNDYREVEPTVLEGMPSIYEEIRRPSIVPNLTESDREAKAPEPAPPPSAGKFVRNSPEYVQLEALRKKHNGNRPPAGSKDRVKFDSLLDVLNNRMAEAGVDLGPINRNMR